MWRLAALVWILAGTVLAGSLVTVVVSVPSLYDQGMKLIPVLGVAGYVAAIPLAWVLARKLMALTGRAA